MHKHKHKIRPMQGRRQGVGQLGKEEQGIIGVKAQYQERQKKGEGKEV